MKSKVLVVETAVIVFCPSSTPPAPVTVTTLPIPKPWVVLLVSRAVATFDDSETNLFESATLMSARVAEPAGDTAVEVIVPAYVLANLIEVEPDTVMVLTPSNGAPTPAMVMEFPTARPCPVGTVSVATLLANDLLVTATCTPAKVARPVGEIGVEVTAGCAT